jgi:hypothetical protein
MVTKLSFAPVMPTARRCAGRLLAAAALLPLPAAALAQVTYTGTAANQNFGSANVGTPKTQTLSFSVAAGTTVGSIAYLTQGAPGLDFAGTTGSACTAKTYTSAATCTLNVTFTPTAPGTRPGGVVFFSGANSTGTVLRQVAIYGNGTGPQLAFILPSSAPTSPIYFQNINNASGIAFDGAGNYYTGINGNIQKYNASGGGSIYWTGPAGQIQTLVIDGAGNLYVTDEIASSSPEGQPTYAAFIVPAGGGAAIDLPATVNGAAFTAYEGHYDKAGNLFVVTNLGLVEIPAGNGTPAIQSISVSGSFAIDGADNFYSFSSSTSVVKQPLGGGASTTITVPDDVGGELAADGEGNLYDVDEPGVRIYSALAGASAFTILADYSHSYVSTAATEQIAVDGQGNVVVMESSPSLGDGDLPFGTLVSVYRSFPEAGLSFATISQGTVSATSKEQGITNIGNAPLAFSAIDFPADYEAGSGATPCTTSESVAVGALCDVYVEFAPQNSGTLNEQVTLIDNSLSIGAGTQSIGVSGTATPDHPAAITSPTPGSQLTRTSVTFTWSGGVGVEQYQFFVGTWGVGAANIYRADYIPGTAASVTIPVPADGVTLHVRLMQELNGVWQTADYTYTESGTSAPAVITGPTSGSTLTATNVTFSWPGGKGTFEYQLRVGTTGPGSSDVYNSPGLFTTSQTVTVPANGVTLYVELAQQLNGVWQAAEYTYTEPGAPTPAAVTSPAPSSTFTATSVTFNWAGGAGPTAYQFLVGTHGVGSGNLLNTFQTHETSATVIVPANGEKIWVRLNQQISGVWTSTDYTYTAAETVGP